MVPYVRGSETKPCCKTAMTATRGHRLEHCPTDVFKLGIQNCNRVQSAAE